RRAPRRSRVEPPRAAPRRDAREDARRARRRGAELSTGGGARRRSVPHGRAVAPRIEGGAERPRFGRGGEEPRRSGERRAIPGDALALREAARRRFLAVRPARALRRGERGGRKRAARAVLPGRDVAVAPRAEPRVAIVAELCAG